jgi:hypothetical protein
VLSRSVSPRGSPLQRLRIERAASFAVISLGFKTALSPVAGRVDRRLGLQCERGSDRDHHFSELSSGFEIAMGYNDLVERKRSCDDWPE